VKLGLARFWIPVELSLPSFTVAMEDEITFCTLGMFIIGNGSTRSLRNFVLWLTMLSSDEIEYRPPIPPAKDIIGGAGSYAAIGARLVTPKSLSKSVGWIVDVGSDFPPEVGDIISSWNTSCLVRQDSSRLTTRGWNGYGEDEQRGMD
jgi:hypothetical protein